MTCGIYKITNKVNGKVYVGQSQDIERRWGEHKRELDNGEHNNKHLQAAYNKYGADNFVWEIVEEYEECELDDREIFYISEYDSFNNGYNQTIGGGGTRGYIVSEETKKRMSVARKGKHHSYETRKKMSENHWNTSGEKNPCYGRTGEKHPMYGKGKKVLCVEIGIIYNTITEASRELNLNQSNISAVCIGKRKTCGGYHFKYVD